MDLILLGISRPISLTERYPYLVLFLPGGRCSASVPSYRRRIPPQSAATWLDSAKRIP